MIQSLIENRNTRLAAAFLLLAVCAQGCKSGSDATPSALVAVQAAQPEVGPISEQIVADATLAPLAQAAITPRITAPVRAFYVRRGSKVQAGELLATLDNRDLTAQALENKGQYDAARAAYNIQTQAQIPADYRKAELDVAQTKAQLHLQEEITASRKKLFEEGAIPGRDYDTAKAALVQARSAYAIAQNQLASLKKVSLQANIQQAKGQLASAKGRYQASEAQVSFSEIRSPIAGVVTDRPLFPGETANPGSILITVMDTSSLLAKVHLAQIVAQRLTVGDTAAVLIPGVDDPVPAKVSLISPALDPGSTTVEVWLKVANKSGKYKVGTSVRAVITGRSVARAIKIPLSAVLTATDGTTSVMVAGADGIAHRRAVQLGINDGKEVQVKQGLSGSEMVITIGAYGLDDGTRVTVGKPADDSGERQ